MTVGTESRRARAAPVRLDALTAAAWPQASSSPLETL